MVGVIAIVSQKGGSGKTTLSLGLAGAAMAAGKKVAVIDLDPQASAATWADDRDYGSVTGPVVESVQHGRLRAFLDHAKEVADLVIIDTAPAADAGSVVAVKACDVLVVPVRPGYFDIKAASATFEVASLSKRQPLVVINACHPNSRQGQDAVGALEGADVEICPHFLSQRADFGSAVMLGQTVFEFDDTGKAAREMRAVATWIFARLPNA